MHLLLCKIQQGILKHKQLTITKLLLMLLLLMLQAILLVKLLKTVHLLLKIVQPGMGIN